MERRAPTPPPLPELCDRAQRPPGRAQQHSSHPHFFLSDASGASLRQGTADPVTGRASMVEMKD